jgi:hypothetical protein
MVKELDRFLEADFQLIFHYDDLWIPGVRLRRPTDEAPRDPEDLLPRDHDIEGHVEDIKMPGREFLENNYR